MFTDKIWYIYIDGREEGPFSKRELRHDLRITPQTLARKEGSSAWLPIGSIQELSDIFEEKEEEKDPILKHAAARVDELALDLQPNPPLLFFVVIALLLLLYSISMMNRD